MNQTLRCRRLSLALLTPFALALSSRAQDQSEPVDHLHHPQGTTTGPAGIAGVERRGHGPVALLLIPGAPFGADAFAAAMARGEDRYTMFAVTLAGYGGTPPPAMPADDQADYANRVWSEAVLQALTALLRDEIVPTHGPAVVVGHHLIADYYAVRLAAEHPELVRGVVSIAGAGSAPVPRSASAEADPAAARLRYVRDSRAPFFRTVSQETWNANTFKAPMLSRDSARGQRLFEAEVSVPIATQVRYYLEYMTDQLESYVERLTVPVLSFEHPSAAADLDQLPQAMKDQLVRQFGSLDKARDKVQIARSGWRSVASHARPGLVHVQEVPDSGAFVMDDAPELFDRALFEFVSALPVPAQSEPATKKDG